SQLREAERIACDSVSALGLRDGIAFPQLIAAEDGRVGVVEVAARIPGGQMADLVRHAVGVDLVEVAARQALGEPVPDEVALPRSPASRSRRRPGPGRRSRARSLPEEWSAPAIPGRSPTRTAWPSPSPPPSRARRSGPPAGTATAAGTSSRRPTADRRRCDEP